MQKRGSTEILATILIVGIAVSLFTFIFVSTRTNFSNIQQTVQRSIDTSKLINFRVVGVVADDTADKLKILLENDQDTQIYSLQVNINNKGQIDSYTIGSVDPFSSKWFELDYIDPSQITKIEIIPQTLTDNTLNIHIQSKEIINQNQIKVKNSQIIARDLICHKCGNHKVPPNTLVEVTLDLYNINSQNTYLIDYFPKDWVVIDPKDGLVTNYDSYYNKISFVYQKDITHYSYLIYSPDLTSPPTKYFFQTEFGILGEKYDVIVSDPESSDFAFSSNNVLCTSPCVGTAAYTIDFNDLKNINDARVLRISEVKSTGRWYFGPSSPMIFNLSYPYQDIDKINLTLYCNQTSTDLENLNIEVFNFNISTWDTLGVACNTSTNKYYYMTICNGQCSINSNAKQYVNQTQPQVNIRFMDSSTDTVQSRWNLDYASLEAVNVTTSIAMSLSTNLSQGINWLVDTLDIQKLNATGNTDPTLYNIQILTVDGNADLYVMANDSLISGPNYIGLGNETFSYSTTDPNVLGQPKLRLTTNFQDNKIGSNIPNGTTYYLKFYLDVPSSQAPGTYFNKILFRTVETGNPP